MYSSLGKLDLVHSAPAGTQAIQTDHRDAAEIDATFAESVLYAVARARNGVLGGACATVGFAHVSPPSARYAKLVAQLGAELEVAPDPTATPGAPDPAAVDEAVRAAVAELGAAAFRARKVEPGVEALKRVGTAFRALRVSDDEEGEPDFTQAVVRLGSALAVVLLDRFGGALVAATKVRGPVPYAWELGPLRAWPFAEADSFLRDRKSAPLGRLVDNIEQSLFEGGPVVFHLRPSTWPHAAASARVPFEPARGTGTDTPVLALGVDTPKQVRALPGGLGGWALATATARAREHLAKLDAPLRPAGIEGVAAWVADNDYYCPEKILDREYMRSVHARVGAKLLLVGIPRKRRLWVHDGHASIEGVGGFCHVVGLEFERAPAGSAISPTVYLVMDGDIVGVCAPVTEGRPGTPPEAARPEEAAAPAAATPAAAAGPVVAPSPTAVPTPSGRVCGQCLEAMRRSPEKPGLVVWKCPACGRAVTEYSVARWVGIGLTLLVLLVAPFVVSIAATIQGGDRAWAGWPVLAFFSGLMLVSGGIVIARTLRDLRDNPKL